MILRSTGQPKWTVNINHREENEASESISRREGDCKHTCFWLRLLEIGLKKTSSNRPSGFCHNNNNQLTPTRPQISLKLIFRLFFLRQGSHNIGAEARWGGSAERIPSSERRKGLRSGSRGGIKIFPRHKHSQRERFWFSWRVFLLSCDSWGTQTGQDQTSGEVKKTDLTASHVPNLWDLCFTTGNTGPSKPPNTREEPQPGHIQHFLSNNRRWNT